MLGELVDHGAPEPSGSHDEDVPDAEPVAPRFLEVAANGRSPREDEENVGGEEEEKHEARVGEAAVEGREAGQEKSREPGRDQHREPFLDARAVTPDAVEPVEVID